MAEYLNAVSQLKLSSRDCQQKQNKSEEIPDQTCWKQIKISNTNETNAITKLIVDCKRFVIVYVEVSTVDGHLVSANPIELKVIIMDRDAS